MFKVESYVTPILLSYVDKYVRDFRPADAQVSLWGGGVALHNLVLKADVLQQEVALPFTLVSGRIHELLIQVPWTKIMSEPIVITINTIECVLSLNPPDASEENAPADQARTEVVQAPPGYMQALVRRIVNNISVRVNSLIVKYVHDDVVLSLNVKRLAVDSVCADWKPAFTDIEPGEPVVRRLVRLDDLTLCLDRTDSDGKIRHYQEPLLYRCQLEIRFQSNLVSVTSRKSKKLMIQLRSSNLEWGVTGEQLLLLLRLLRERAPVPPPAADAVPPAHALAVAGVGAEQARAESWSDWAWSWVPSWKERDDDVEEPPAPAAALPILFSAFVDNVAFIYKVVETEMGSNRKRARPLLELRLRHAALTSFACVPTTLRVRIGARGAVLTSRGKCVCGHLDINALNDNPTVYVTTNYHTSDDYEWPEDLLDLAHEDTEMLLTKSDIEPQEAAEVEEVAVCETVEQGAEAADEELVAHRDSMPEFMSKEGVERMWFQMLPAVFLQWEHDRRPPSADTNPYENPPRRFEYSDWVEHTSVHMALQPMVLHVRTGLLHRLELVHELLQDLPPLEESELTVRPLTVEELEALTENLPERRINITLRGAQIHFTPWDHSLTEQPAEPLATVELIMHSVVFKARGPLYSSRVCAAACQLPDPDSALHSAANVRVYCAMEDFTVHISSKECRPQRPLFSMSALVEGHYLLHKELFEDKEIKQCGAEIRSAKTLKISTSAPSASVVTEVLDSLYHDRPSNLLKHTSLVEDALCENDTTSMEVSITNLAIMPRVCENAYMVTITLYSIDISVMEIKNGVQISDIWLFAAPDDKKSTHQWMQFKMQYCPRPEVAGALDYVLFETGSCAVNIDPFLLKFLAYRPRLQRHDTPMCKESAVKSMSTSNYFIRRRTTPPSSSGRGSKAGSAVEFVHTRTRSAESNAGRRERPAGPPIKKMKLREKLWDDESLLWLYKRLRRVLVRVDAGDLLIHIPTSASDMAPSYMRRVLVIDMGRWRMDTRRSELWADINSDYPTFLQDDDKISDSFPWKLKITEVSSYTTETSPGRHNAGLETTQPRVVLASFPTSATISVVTKREGARPPPPPPPPRRPPSPSTADQDQKTNFFTSGVDFQPSTFREYMRGPKARPGTAADGHDSPEPDDEGAGPPGGAGGGAAGASLVSIGVCVHIDTPPINVDFALDQVHVVRAALHSISHVWALLSKPKTPIPAPSDDMYRPGSAPLIRLQTEHRSSSEDTPSENPSEQLIPIFESHSVAHDQTGGPKTFIWVQWVLSHASISCSNDDVKLTLDIDDVLITLDLQDNYEQLRLKISSATVFHMNSVLRDGSQPWEMGELGGRVLETRDTDDGKSMNFFSATVTRARSANMPATWRDDLNLKPLRQNIKHASVWEVYMLVAPLELLLHPQLVAALALMAQSLRLPEFCSVPLARGAPDFTMPFCHVDLARVRTSIHTSTVTGQDDTLVINIDSLKILPYPENPICRRSINTMGEASWIPAASGRDGRQHELIIKSFSVHSAKISELMPKIREARARHEGSVNPAAKWANALPAVKMTPIVHRMDLQGVAAPPVYCGGKLACGPALELGAHSDLTVELSLHQITMLARMAPEVLFAYNEQHSGCEYPPFNMDTRTWCPLSCLQVLDEQGDGEADPSDEAAVAGGVSDSGAESQPSTSRGLPVPPTSNTNVPTKQPLGMFDHVELYMVMGRIDFALYMMDNPEDPLIQSMHLPPVPTDANSEEPTPNVTIVIDSRVTESSRREPDMSTVGGSRSLTETVRVADVGRSRLHVVGETTVEYARRRPNAIPIMHVTLYQPNMYYWRKVNITGMQMSLFNAWVALGEGLDIQNTWHHTLLSTRPGSPDPNTEIPPSLLSMRLHTHQYDDNLSGICEIAKFEFKTLHPDTIATCISPENQCDVWSVEVDVERPVVLDLAEDTLPRLGTTVTLIQRACANARPVRRAPAPILHLLRETLVSHRIERVRVRTGQAAVRWGGVTAACEGVSAQAGCGAHPPRLSARALVCALAVTAQEEAPGQRRHVLLQPLMIGVQAEAAWEVWRGGEGFEPRRGYVARDNSDDSDDVDDTVMHDATVRAVVEMDEVAVDLRPCDVDTAAVIIDNVRGFLNSLNHDDMAEDILAEEDANAGPRVWQSWPLDGDLEYLDDLRSGAFKMSSGDEARMPMAYEVSVRASTVVWQYPMPRCIVAITASPLPDCDEEVECVLEFFNPLVDRWEKNWYFKIPVTATMYYRVHHSDLVKVFAYTWRVRLAPDTKEMDEPYEFRPSVYTPGDDPVARFAAPAESWARAGRVTGAQLVGVLRVDSLLSTRLAPRRELAVRCGALALHAYNKALPERGQNDPANVIPGLEGIYVSNLQRESHRVLSLVAKDGVINAMRSDCVKQVSFDGKIGLDMFESETGTMEYLMEEARLQAVLVLSPRLQLRLRAGDVHLLLNVPRVHTLYMVAEDWSESITRYIKRNEPLEHDQPRRMTQRPHDTHTHLKWLLDRKKKVRACKALEGRVFLFIVNTCDTSLRVGQEGTDEALALAPNTTLTYRWYSPSAPKKLRFSRTEPKTDIRWSVGVLFEEGRRSVRLPEADEPRHERVRCAGTRLHLRVEDTGARRLMHVGGRLVMSNMLRHDLSYKVRVVEAARGAASSAAQAALELQDLAEGELLAESAGHSVLIDEDRRNVYIKIKFSDIQNGWTGDIPLKVCPKENIPWLVKVPSMSDIEYMSVWCRVIKTSSDGRINVTFWPMFVLVNHLPLDIDMAMMTATSDPAVPPRSDDMVLPALTQSARGRGHCEHLMLHGTTTVCHTLSFRYTSVIECPLTREPVPLHYGLTERPVFDQYNPPDDSDIVTAECIRWLKVAGVAPKTEFPYSIVRSHWTGYWHPLRAQGRCEIVVHYEPLVSSGCAGGMITHVMPRALFANATPLTVRVCGSNGMPLARLAPGVVNAPPSAILEGGFHVGVVVDGDTYMSRELAVSDGEFGPYCNLRRGQIALDRFSDFIVVCDTRAALLTLYYEMHRQINVFGLTCSYVFVNNLSVNVLLSPMIANFSRDDPPVIRPPSFGIVKPHNATSGRQLGWFWKNSPTIDAEVVMVFCVLSLPGAADAARTGPSSVPVRIDHMPLRHAISLMDSNGEPVPVVVTHVKHEGRNIVTLSPDPRPQFLFRNVTDATLVIAQPIVHERELVAKSLAPGTKHWFVVEPQRSSYYTQPPHLVPNCPRHNPHGTNIRKTTMMIGYLEDLESMTVTWGHFFDETWDNRVVQIPGRMHIKIRVGIHPHSTLIELSPIIDDDLMAAHIRYRLAQEDAFYEQNPFHNGFNDRDAGGQAGIGEHQRRVEDPPASNPKSPRNPNMLAELEVKLQEVTSTKTIAQMDFESETSIVQAKPDMDWEEGDGTGWMRAVAGRVLVELTHSYTGMPLLRAHCERVTLLVHEDDQAMRTVMTVGEVQVDNPQHRVQRFDFPVVASTAPAPLPDERFPPLWGMLSDGQAFAARSARSKFVLRFDHDRWKVMGVTHQELAEVCMYVGPLSLYVEDALVRSVAALYRKTLRPERILALDRDAHARPLRLRRLHIHQLDITLTLRTAMRVYIALDRSPLRLSAFDLEYVVTTQAELVHLLTVHYLSGAILGAGWVVGALELVGAPGALAARVARAGGGLIGVASTTAAALLRSLSACAGSLARNLDLLAGDPHHTERAALARRVTPQTFMSGIITGIQNFGVNMLGAVGGLVHHPLVGVAVGEASGVTAIRRSLLGALAKPLSATADLVAFAGQGLLSQTGWDPDPEERRVRALAVRGAWQRDCVRWGTRLTQLRALYGVEATLEGATRHLVVTDKFLVVSEPTTERIVEMIDFRFCKLVSYDSQEVELRVTHRRPHNESSEFGRSDEGETPENMSAAMVRVARYTGALPAAAARGGRPLRLRVAPRHGAALAAAIAVGLRHATPTHLHLL